MFDKEAIRLLLPIGSVVTIKGAKRPLMIAGVCQTDANNPQVTADYLGVLYPEGYLGTGSQFFFQHSSIDKVIFEGYRSTEWAQLLERIIKFYEEK